MRLAYLPILAALAALLCLPPSSVAWAAADSKAASTFVRSENAVAPRAARLICETLPLTAKSTCNEICAKRDQACVAAATSAINPARQEPLACETRHDKDPSDIIICRCCAVR